jgi:hypothetical protein
MNHNRSSTYINLASFVGIRFIAALLQYQSFYPYRYPAELFLSSNRNLTYIFPEHYLTTELACRQLEWSISIDTSNQVSLVVSE